MLAMSRAPVLSACLFGLGLVASSCSAVSKVDYTECTENTTCRDAFGLGWQCGDAGLCVEVASNRRCRETWPEDLLTKPEKYENYIILGSLFDHTPTTGDLVLVNAASLAISEANQSGLNEGRKYGIVHCGYQADSDIDDLQPEDAVAADARFLVEAYGTPVIIGPGTSSLAEAAFTELQDPELGQTTLLISPSATSPALTNIDVRDGDEPGLFWRTAPPDSLLGEVLANRMMQGDEELMTTSVTDAAIIFVNDSYGQGLANELDRNFTGALESYSYDNPQNIGSLVLSAVAKLKGKVDGGASVGVVFIGSTVEDVVAFIKTTGTEADFFSKITIFLGDAARNKDVIDKTESSSGAAFYPRVRGVFPSPVDIEDLVYKNFRNNYAIAFDGESTEASYSAHTYDATWLAIYGTAWAEYQRDGALTGQDIAYGLQQISAVDGRPIEVGAIDWNTVKSEFKAGRPINILGASGPLDYERDTEETKSPIEYWRINAANEFETLAIIEPL